MDNKRRRSEINPLGACSKAAPPPPPPIPRPMGAVSGALPLGLQHCSKAPAPSRVVRGRRAFGSQSYLRSWDLSEPGQRLEEDSKEHQEMMQAALLLESLVPTRLQADAEACAVCREPMRRAELVRRLPCAHVFHAACIARWLCVKATCPLDKSDVRKALEDGPRTAAPNSPSSGTSSPLYQPSRSPSPRPGGSRDAASDGPMLVE
ncbi:unnamed protein product [Effrenium voratum]|nr:unnamed protein product [Effrenium voratum]